MKKYVFPLAIALSLSITTTSCDTIKSASSIASAAGIDVGKVTSGVLGVLTSKLGLSSTQTPLVTSAVTNLLTEKASIMGLQQTDPPAYATKFGSMFSGFKSKMSGILTATQMTNFLNLKPKTNDATNVLSNLFY